MSSQSVFFSHATEDKGRVLQVYARLIERYPELDPWIDTFEIKGGQDLLDQIAEGMDESHRMFVFLSPTSVEKPWVQAELKRALTQDISGDRPGYVVPVKMSGLKQVPAFMESKKYIDLDRLTEVEWLGEFYAAATGAALVRTVPMAPNLVVGAVVDPGAPHVVQFGFSVRHWAEDASFKVPISVPALAVRPDWVSGGPIGSYNFAELLTPNHAGYAVAHRITPGADFRITVTFPEGTIARDCVGDPQLWDGSGAASSGIAFPPPAG